MSRSGASDVPPTEVDGERLGPRDCCLVGDGGKHREDPSVGFCLEVNMGEHPQVVPIIPVVVVGTRLFVALPGGVWHRKATKRLLPPGALVKPTLASVAGVVAGEDPSHPSDGAEIKVWVAYVSAELEAEIRQEVAEDIFEPPFTDAQGRDCAPYAPALIALADDHFSFLTAESGAAKPERHTEDKFEKRVSAMESSLAEIRETLKTLAGSAAPQVPPHAKAQSPASAGPPKAKAASQASIPAGLDRSVVAAARAAGISKEHLGQMAQLLKEKPGTLKDLPALKTRQGPLSESEGEEPDEVAEPGMAEGGDPLQQAVVELTKIAKSLAMPKREKPDLEALLGYGSLGDRGDASSSSSTRRNSAALSALRKALRESPALIYEPMEKNMREDFGLREPLPGEPPGLVTARSWLQSRSRVQNYTNHVRWMWQIAAVWDCLMQDRVQEARARVALLMAAGEQSSIDSGNWLISTVSLLEGPPPYQQFSHHAAPASHELQHSALLDPRWFELFLWQLKEQESYQEARRKLTQRRPGGGEAAKDETDQGPKGPRGKAKAKGTSGDQNQEAK